MLAVSGATGVLGSRVAARLAALGLSQRLIVRDPARAPRLAGAEIARVDSYADARALGRALSGVETLFLVSARDLFGVSQASAKSGTAVPPYNRLRQQLTAVDAAAAVGVRRLVYLSFMNAAPDATFILSHDHFYTEERIRELGFEYTFLRPALYMDNVPRSVSNDYVMRLPAGEGRAAWVAREDIADTVVAVLTGEGHNGRTYEVTGPEALSMSETAEQLSAAAGRRIRYQSQTPHEARTERTTSRLEAFEAERRALTGQGLNEFEVEVFVTHFLQIATGELATVSDSVPRLTGHPALSLRQYLERYPESCRHLR